MKTLKKFINIAILDEAIQLSKKSVDNQIDSILLKFEADCIVIGDINDVVESINLNEAPKTPEFGEPIDSENEEDDTKAVDKSDKDKEEVLDASVEGQKPDPPADPLKPKIDLEKFAGKVARLAINFASLLDMQTAIANRAVNYIEQNYNKKTSEELAEILTSVFKINVERDKQGMPKEDPLAVGAAASGLG